MAEAADKPNIDKRKTGDVKIKEAENINEWRDRDNNRKSMDALQKKTTPLTTEEQSLEGDNANTDADGQPTDAKDKKKSKKKLKEEAKKLASMLSTDLEFKSIGFETALTKDEKAAKKKAKLEAKKAAKIAKLIESGQAPPKEKKSKKSAKSKSVTTSEEEAPTAEGEETPKTEAEKNVQSEKKSKKETAVKKAAESDKKKGKKGGKKGKKELKSREEEEEPATIMDILRKRASMVMEDYERQRSQSQILQGRLSVVSRRPSEMEKKQRKPSRQMRDGRTSSLVQINEDGSGSSLGIGSSMVLVDKTETDGKKKGKKGKKGKQDADVREDKQHRPSVVNRRKSSGVKVKKKSIYDESADDDARKSISDISLASAAKYHDDEDRKKKKVRRKSHVKKTATEDSPHDTEKATHGRKVSEDVQSARMSKTSRYSRVSRISRSSKVSYLRRKSSQDSDYELEPLVKRDVPPMIPILELAVPEMVPVIAEESKEVPKKGDKKGKKDKKGKVKEVKEVPMEELSPMEQIALMKAQAEAATAALLGLETEPEPEPEPEKKKKEKKSKGKKMSKSQRAAYNAEKLEQERLALEAEAAAAAEAERIRLNNERRMATETAKRETLEQTIRSEQLQSSVENTGRYRDKRMAHEATVKQEEEWIEYLACDGLPAPSHCAAMNTYLHLWEKELPTVDMEQAEKKTNEVLKLLKTMDQRIDSPYFGDADKIANWKWVRGLVREQQVKNLDAATYHLLRNIAQKMQRLDIPTADYRLQSTMFSLCVWLKVQLPIPLPNPRIPPPARIKLKFPEMGMKVFFPTCIDCKKMAIKAMYLKYDHLSDTCSTFDKPPTPEHYNINLQQATTNEWYQKMFYKYTNRAKPKKIEITLEDGTITTVDPEPVAELPPGEIPPAVPYMPLTPNAEDYVLLMEEDVYRSCRENLMKSVPASVLNMREYVILGGVFCLDLYYQPPQPQSMVTYELTFTTLLRPLSLEEVPFYRKYMPPVPVAPGVRRSPEEIEEELKQQETELDKLIFVNLNMPQHVIWLDVPIVVLWDSRANVWTKKHIYDFKHIEEKNYLTFRTTVFGNFGLATNKYASLPYQAWELKPEIDGTVTLQITTALLMLEFNIKGSLVSMTQLQNSPNNALQDIVGKYYKLSTLKKLLIDGGVDIFPEADAFCYIARTCEKHYPTERHMYEQMAQLAGVFNFSWSRWNLPVGRRSIVCQMREFKIGKQQRQRPHSMLMVTPLKAVFIDCTEVSPVFNEEPTTDDTKMYADLYHLMKGTFKVAIRVKVHSQPADMVNTLAQLLIQTRVNSFS